MNKVLNVRFPEVTKLKINDLAKSIELSDSPVARAALSIGLKKLNEMASFNVDETKEFIRIENIKAQL